MSESFVDLSYRGLGLGKRIKLTQVRAATGYLEVPAPMPVGTTLGIATDDGVLLEVTVTEVHEQVGGTDKPPGMVVKPKLEADAARAWWKQRVSLKDEKMPAASADGKVTVVSRRNTADNAVPELMDDGRNTAVMEVVDDTKVADLPADGPTDRSVPSISAEMAAVRDSNPNLVDDGKRTMMMDAVDLAALGLDPSTSSPSLPAATDSGQFPADDPDSGVTDPGNGGKKKKKKKR